MKVEKRWKMIRARVDLLVAFHLPFPHPPLPVLLMFNF